MSANATPVLKSILKKCKGVERLDSFGRRHTGHLATTPSGARVFFLNRRNKQMWRGEGLSQSDSILNDVASWGIDTDLLRDLKRKGVTNIIVFVTDTADFYTSQIDDWFDTAKARDRETKGFGLSPLRHLRLEFMRKGTVYTHLTLR